MADKAPEMVLKSIGTVRNEISRDAKPDDVKNIISEIIVDGSLTESLDNLDDFSHIIILIK